MEEDVLVALVVNNRKNHVIQDAEKLKLEQVRVYQGKIHIQVVFSEKLMPMKKKKSGLDVEMDVQAVQLQRVN